MNWKEIFEEKVARIMFFGANNKDHASCYIVNFYDDFYCSNCKTRNDCFAIKKKEGRRSHDE